MGKKKRPRKVRDGGHALHDALETIAIRLGHLANQIPEDTDSIPEAEWDGIRDIVHDIWSIEEEWILDEDLRKELSIIQVED